MNAWRPPIELVARTDPERNAGQHHLGAGGADLVGRSPFTVPSPFRRHERRCPDRAAIRDGRAGGPRRREELEDHDAALLLDGWRVGCEPVPRTDRVPVRTEHAFASGGDEHQERAPGGEFRGGLCNRPPRRTTWPTPARRDAAVLGRARPSARVTVVPHATTRPPRHEAAPTASAVVGGSPCAS
jgi:hypothetical protein